MRPVIPLHAPTRERHVGAVSSAHIDTLGTTLQVAQHSTAQHSTAQHVPCRIPIKPSNSCFCADSTPQAHAPRRCLLSQLVLVPQQVAECPLDVRQQQHQLGGPACAADQRQQPHTGGTPPLQTSISTLQTSISTLPASHVDMSVILRNVKCNDRG